MISLLVISSEKGSGKTAVSAGLGKYLISSRRKVGFLKPAIVDSQNRPEPGADRDAEFMKQLFHLKEAAGTINPVLGDQSQLQSNLKEALAKVSGGKDVVIIESPTTQNQVAFRMAEVLNARVVAIESYAPGLARVASRYRNFGDKLLGMVINKVPRNRLESVRNEVSSQLSKAQISLLGVLPEDRTLTALTIGELATHLQGEIISGAEKSAGLIENVMLGAMCVDPGPEYFGRKANKAVVIKSERPDMQMAALETSTRCLILTGGEEARPVVRQQAADKGIPIILVRDNTTSVATSIEDALSSARFNQEDKLPVITRLMESYFDFQALDRGLGPLG